MNKNIVSLGDCSFELLLEDNEFLGIGAIHIGDTLLRSGRLPIRPYTQSFLNGTEIARLHLVSINESKNELCINLAAHFQSLPVKLMRDHSFDPIHDMSDWDTPTWSGCAQIALILRLAEDSFAGEAFTGFSYHYQYESVDTPIFYLLDRASWEIDGDIVGATVISQSSCSDPMVSFTTETAWSTEGIFYFPGVDRSNPVMTHNLPRWASHQAFDFQYKSGRLLLGVYERLDLIRTLLQREAGKAELKTADKHIFDETLRYSTVPKALLINYRERSLVGVKNIWTWTMDEIHNRARAEFDLQEEPMIPHIHCNYWDNFVIDDYRKDLLPVAEKLGFEAIFIDNVNKSAMSEHCPHPDWHWNMCCGHEYEVAPNLGGKERLAAFVADCKALGIRPLSWTNNDQALSSPLNRNERANAESWFVIMEDCRQKFGGAYMGCMNVLNFSRQAPRQYWVDSLIKVKEETGLDNWLFDSFYNLGFMPVDYNGVRPSTQWRGVVAAIKELQDAGIRMHIESFGPFGIPFHGCPAEYAQPERIFAAYKVYAQVGYTTVPSGDATVIDDFEIIFRFFAHMASPLFTLFSEGKRLDEGWGEKHIRALANYSQLRDQMKRRILQEDGKAVLWHDSTQRQATLWNFVERTISLPGQIIDVTTDKELPPADKYSLAAMNCYIIRADHLPEQIGLSG